MPKKVFATSVLHDITSKNNLLFKKFDPTYVMLKPHEVIEKIEELTAKLPTGPDVLYRGSEGTNEIIDAMQSNFLGKLFKCNSKAASFDIAGYIRNNDSKFFLSFSPCKETVKPYAAGLSVIPCKGYIMVTGLPKVYTIPHKLLYLNRGMFERCDDAQMKRRDLDDPRAYQSIIRMTENNNEVTAILGASEQDDWRPVVANDVKRVIEVCGPGRICSKFMSSNEVAYVREWENLGFSKRIYALEAVFYGGPGHFEDFEMMNEKARDMRLMNKDERLITLEDVPGVIRELDKLNELYDTTETQRITSVPKNIGLGDKNTLTEFMIEKLKAGKTLTEKQELRRFSIE